MHASQVDENVVVTSRRRAGLIGILFLAATAIGFMNLALLGPVFSASDVVAEVAGASNQIVAATILNSIMALAIVAIAAWFYPVLASTSKPMAIAYFVTRLAEGIILALAGILWLGLLPNVLASAPSVVTILDWSNVLFGIGAQVVFGVTAIILNIVLLRAKMVPSVISVWGLIGGILIFGYGTGDFLGADIAAYEPYFFGPIALNELVLAVWLLVKGLGK